MILSSLAASGAQARERVDLEAAKKRYAEIVNAELGRKILPGVSVAWIVDGVTVHADGYGQADADRGIAATADTIYRAGSISKLFNAVAAMQLVEQGKLDLDAPIENALSEFHIVVPFAGATAITARQMLCHRSGMIREAPVGGYLDPSQPSVAAVVASVAPCVLVNPPNTKTRYSNVGPTIVGRALEVLSGLPYAEYQQRHVLGPLGMTSSVWVMNDTLRPRLAKGLMRVARQDHFVLEPAPQFELGTIPAGNLYTTAADLARFAAFMMGSGSTSESAILKRSTLEKMFQPQLTQEATGFGLGFSVNRYREHKTVQHTGAVYGFSTSLVVLPETRIGVIVLANADIASGPVKRLSDAALDLLLETARGEPPDPAPASIELPSDILAELPGEYLSTSYWARVEVVDRRVSVVLSGQPLELTAVEPLKFLADGRIMYRSPIEFERAADGHIAGFKAAGQHFERVGHAELFRAPPDEWRGFVGSYGEPFIPLVISAHYGHLWATVENEYDYRLGPVNRMTFNLPPGMYADEQVVFMAGADGLATGVVMANQYLKRRAD